MRNLEALAESDDMGTSCCTDIVCAPGRGCNGLGGAGVAGAHVPKRTGEESVYAIIDCNAIIDCMASITIRNLEESTKRKLKIRAATHGRSMEQEAREILKHALGQKPKTGAELVKRIRAIWEPLGGLELEPLSREPMRDPEWLKDWK
jgi:plasmid stability protein